MLVCCKTFVVASVVVDMATLLWCPCDRWCGNIHMLCYCCCVHVVVGVEIPMHNTQNIEMSQRIAIVVAMQVLMCKYLCVT